ncbi:MbnP family protein [Chitinophaga sp. 30R24]|uniref:MbnP family protein n=1 Tax=Chitinophaga sp. 30R24 TaxID=3248838 RepID=UPI003B8F9160
MVLRIFISYACWFLLVNTLLARAAGNTSRQAATMQLPPASSLQLAITHVVGAQPLVRNQVTYTNPSGEYFTITRFRYFLSNFSLENVQGYTVTLPAAYFLVDDAIDTSKVIHLFGLPAGQYKSIRFLIGVDSVRNVSGAQPGALAVESGMFWTWNSGYIMAQLEGHSFAITSPTQEFLFHIGGYRQVNGVLKYVTLPFSQPVTVAPEKEPRIQLVADVSKWFLPDTVSFKQIAVIMAPGANARKVAGNYQHMFTISKSYN